MKHTTSASSFPTYPLYIEKTPVPKTTSDPTLQRLSLVWSRISDKPQKTYPRRNTGAKKTEISSYNATNIADQKSNNKNKIFKYNGKKQIFLMY